ncbi:MAG: glycosyltransferase [Pseudomonadota bacterium]
MIVIEAGRRDARSLDARLLFAADLAAHGYDAVIDEETVPDALARATRYDAAPYLAARADLAPAAIVVIGAEEIGDDALITLRDYALEPDVPIAALGRFPSHQARMGAEARLAHATARTPAIVDLEAEAPGIAPGTLLPLLAAVRAAPSGATTPTLAIAFGADLLEDPQTLPLLTAMNNLGALRLRLITTGKAKDEIKGTRYAALPVFSITELPPMALARGIDILAVLGSGPPGERVASLATALLARGGAVIDSTDDAALAATGAPVLRGPATLAGLPGFAEHTVLPNRAEIARAAAADAWIARHALPRIAALAGLPAPPERGQRARAPRALFVPTNGNGLGHAQRAAQIAGALPAGLLAAFCAFPSCLPLLNARGFPAAPLVSPTGAHEADDANDVLNALRLARAIRPGDQLVFDGGYVFTSIFRTIFETGAKATWVRRGLWRPGQIAESHLDREKAFDQVIVPGEAFDELNTDLSFGPHIHKVGPILQAAGDEAPDETRKTLTGAIGAEFTTLVVSMLGGGVAADRTAQLQTISAALAHRPETAHVIVAWPGAALPPALAQWPNTHVVTTLAALPLARAADLVISAAGYNTFHELIYARTPAIFIPQIAPYMDDQERRARAASDRGVALTVLPDELIALSRAIEAVLDHGEGSGLSAALADLTLPATGTGEAARRIAELMA